MAVSTEKQACCDQRAEHEFEYCVGKGRVESIVNNAPMGTRGCRRWRECWLVKVKSEMRKDGRRRELVRPVLMAQAWNREVPPEDADGYLNEDQ